MWHGNGKRESNSKKNQYCSAQKQELRTCNMRTHRVHQGPSDLQSAPRLQHVPQRGAQPPEAGQKLGHRSAGRQSAARGRVLHGLERQRDQLRARAPRHAVQRELPRAPHPRARVGKVDGAVHLALQARREVGRQRGQQGVEREAVVVA